MNIVLKSDFKDWYDQIFYGIGVVRMGAADFVWERNLSGGMTRREMFAFFKQLGIPTPPNGLVKDVVPTMIETLKRELGMVDDEILSLDLNVEAAKASTQKEKLDLAVRETQQAMMNELTQVVVYTDETAHRGEGKELVAGEVALRDFPDHYCSQYKKVTVDGSGYSQRMLCVGDRTFLLEYHSPNDWRSNWGNDVQIAVTHRVAGRLYPIPSPVHAIDFIGIGAEFYAIDFNIAPSLEPVKEYITATEIYDEVAKWFSLNPKAETA